MPSTFTVHIAMVNGNSFMTGRLSDVNLSCKTVGWTALDGVGPRPLKVLNRLYDIHEQR